MKLLGTDLLVSGSLSARQLVKAFCGALEIRPQDIYQAKLFDWEAPSSPRSAPESYFATIGKRNTMLIHELPEREAARFVVDMEFITPLQTRNLQELCDRFDLEIGLSRDTVFRDEIGTISGEGYVLLRRAENPVFAYLSEGEDGEKPACWEILKNRPPALPGYLYPEES